MGWGGLIRQGGEGDRAGGRAIEWAKAKVRAMLGGGPEPLAGVYFGMNCIAFQKLAAPPPPRPPPPPTATAAPFSFSAALRVLGTAVGLA